MDPVSGFESVDPAQPDEKAVGTIHYFGSGTKYFTGIVMPLEHQNPCLRKVGGTRLFQAHVRVVDVGLFVSEIGVLLGHNGS